MELSYFNYDKTMQKASIHPSEFFWNGIGDEILERVLPGTSIYFTELLTFIKNFTENRIGSEENIDSEPIRIAIWNYTQRLFGIAYEYYNYADVNYYLSIPTKTYIKKVACYPHAVTRNDFWAAMSWLQATAEEMIHIAALITEAKREVEILYLVKALKSHLDSFR